MGARREPSRYTNSRRAQQGQSGSRGGGAIWRISPDQTSTVVMRALVIWGSDESPVLTDASRDGSAPHARIFSASATWSAAMAAVTGASTPSVSQVGCGVRGYSGYIQRRQAVRPGRMATFNP